MLFYIIYLICYCNPPLSVHQSCKRTPQQLHGLPRSGFGRYVDVVWPLGAFESLLLIRRLGCEVHVLSAIEALELLIWRLQEDTGGRGVTSCSLVWFGC